MKISVLPSHPGVPVCTPSNSEKDLLITWSAPEQGNYKEVTEYRVECREENQDWTRLGNIAAMCDRRLDIFDWKNPHFNQVRVIAINNDGESEPSDRLVV